MAPMQVMERMVVRVYRIVMKRLVEMTAVAVFVVPAMTLRHSVHLGNA
jgi:hypothetical protein